jgi:hypothetical protein
VHRVLLFAGVVPGCTGHAGQGSAERPVQDGTFGANDTPRGTCSSISLWAMVEMSGTPRGIWG